jgi:hypothetical protein
MPVFQGRWLSNTVADSADPDISKVYIDAKSPPY